MPNIVVVSLLFPLFLTIFPMHIANVEERTPGPLIFTGESKLPPKNGAKMTENSKVHTFVNNKLKNS
tara:strand:- start:621 stop:821 length:201 start_codon:yes stop_codon:yes gene_type:complete